MTITYTRALTNEEAYIAAGMLRDINAERAAKEMEPITLDAYAGGIFDAAVDSWLLQQVRKQTSARAADVEALPLAGQLHVLATVDAKLAEIEQQGGK